MQAAGSVFNPQPPVQPSAAGVLRGRPRRWPGLRPRPISLAEYRARWGLPADYPMVAPDYAEKRRTLAKQIGLGRKPGQRRGRPKKGS